MEHLWSPWRYKYITTPEKQSGCVFCNMSAEQADDKNNIVYRASLNYIILNLFPYTNGHLMIVPFKHEGSLTSLEPETTAEMMELTKRSLRALEAEYHPDGFNVGFNLGRSAGAGVADHVHLHIVPRWSGDANFLTVIGETRVMPEDLATTYERLRKHFGRNHAQA